MCVRSVKRVFYIRVVSTSDPSPHFLQGRAKIAQRFGFTNDFLTERNTRCLSEDRKSFVELKIKRDRVDPVRNAG